MITIDRRLIKIALKNNQFIIEYFIIISYRFLKSGKKETNFLSHFIILTCSFSGAIMTSKDNESA